jgi:hypothetical protein
VTTSATIISAACIVAHIIAHIVAGGTLITFNPVITFVITGAGFIVHTSQVGRCWEDYRLNRMSTDTPSTHSLQCCHIAARKLLDS